MLRYTWSNTLSFSFVPTKETATREDVPRRRGRPRSSSADTAILDAAARVMAERGYRGMTVGAVARAAGVSQPTVYLRHPTKHDLAVAAIAHLPGIAHPPDTGDTRRDLAGILEDLVRDAERIGLSLVGTVLAEEPDHPQLLEEWRKHAGGPMVGSIRAVLERGRSRGQVRPDADLGATAELLLGAYVGRYTTAGPPPGGWSRRVVAVLWPHLEARGVSPSRGG
ncbi:MAG TPA: TetR/AcrR family transcriptional regulator [Acidimicrobiales bacterium]|nr:TetR/AcrR family transcriptional regulator [Acidimicrobiales bacterium]